MNKCKGITLQGKICNRTCKEGIEFCGYHSKSKTVQINHQPTIIKQSITLTFYNNTLTVEPFTLIELQNQLYGDIINLNTILKQFDNRHTELADILLVKNYITDNIYEDLLNVNWDKKIFLRNKIVNRIEKYVITINKEKQEPNYNIGEYRVLKYDNFDTLNNLKDKLLLLFNQESFICQGDYYYNHEKLNLKYQGSKVNNMICIHLGDPIKLSYKWFFANKSVSDDFMITLNHGDLYIMNEKATGHDCKLKKNTVLKYSYTN